MVKHLTAPDPVLRTQCQLGEGMFLLFEIGRGAAEVL